ncbi:MAG: GntR family transcriptional regulator, partial [Planctomycetes bacterium]|nr:GntR family transcriptional regulator [Planctomycetota bacterium]
GGTVAARALRAADRPPRGEEPASRRAAFEEFFYAKLARGELRPGDVFSELQLAHEAELNTVPVREGLLAIARTGLVAKEPRRRWTVVRLDARMVDELFELRELFELHAVRAAVALPDGDPLLDQLRGILDEHAALARRPRVADFLRLDERFHRTLLACARNRYVAEQFATISMLIRFQLAENQVGERGMRLGLAAHPQVIRAVLARDVAGAERAMREHLGGAHGITLLAAGVGQPASPE